MVDFGKIWEGFSQIADMGARYVMGIPSDAKPQDIAAASDFMAQEAEFQRMGLISGPRNFSEFRQYNRDTITLFTQLRIGGDIMNRMYPHLITSTSSPTPDPAASAIEGGALMCLDASYDPQALTCH